MQLLLINCFSANLLKIWLKIKTLNEIANETQFLKNAIKKAQTNNAMQSFISSRFDLD